MAKKRLTEKFPCLIPLRIRQRKFCFYLGMRFDGRKYAKTQSNQLLPYETFASSCHYITAPQDLIWYIRKTRYTT